MLPCVFWLKRRNGPIRSLHVTHQNCSFYVSVNLSFSDIFFFEQTFVEKAKNFTVLVHTLIYHMSVHIIQFRKK